jgi:CBS domain-containing protein
LLSKALYLVEDLFGHLPLHWMWWPLLGGLAIGLGGLLEPRALGIGFDVISDLLNNRLALAAVASLLLVKAVIWVIALGSGTSGGVLAPLLMLGAGLGMLLASVLPGASPQVWPLVCMAAVLAGVLGAPLTALAFALELTHDLNALLPLMLATAVSYGLTIFAMPRSIMTEKIARRGLHIYREYGVDPLERLFVQELMTDAPVSIPSAKRVAAVMADEFGPQQRHRSYPVVDEHGVLLGMLDRAVLQTWLEASGQAGSAGLSIAELYNTSAARAQPPQFALAGETCRSVAIRMATRQAERLPVVASADRPVLVGIISRSDLVKPGLELFAQEQEREGGMFAGSAKMN